MSKALSDYLQREHTRLESELAELVRDRIPDQVLIARLKKLKLAVKDQMTELARGSAANVAA